jgi:uncharacterized beta-barrel protein YwiB (DUF1934 family)
MQVLQKSPNISITIDGTYTGEEEIHLTHHGVYRLVHQKHIILYNDSMLKIDDHTLELKRHGEINTCMIFQKDSTHICDYQTPVGMLSLQIATTSFELLNQEDQLSLHLSYHLYMNGQHLSDNHLSIHIMPLINP